MMGSGPGSFDLPARVDVLVAGSGAAGLTAALTAAVSGRSVVLVEAADRFGGTTALSGGRVWLPPAETSEDSPEAATQYLTAVFGGASAPMVAAFVNTARQMASFVERHSRHRFVVCPSYPDYHPDLPGSTAGGRAHDAAPTALGELAREASNIYLPPGYIPITHAEWEAWRFPDRYDFDLIAQRMEGPILTNGASLIAALIDGCLRANATLVTNCALVDAEQRSADDPVFALIGGEKGTTTIEAGVMILATGGFDASAELRSEWLPSGLDVSASVPTNTGIALRLARERRHAVDNLSQGWWMPMVQVPNETLDGAPYPRSLVRERGVPHQVAVNRAGRRFVDEACPYHEFVKAMLQRRNGECPNRVAWLVFDEQFRSRYPFPGLEATGPVPGHVATDRSLEQLGTRLGIDPKTLIASIERWNGHCRAGRDTDFARGENGYDRYYGDPRLASGPNLGTIERPPFYAVPIASGTIGSKGGPVTTANGQILDTEGRTQPRWYAVGNAAASWTSDGYPAPGSTLGIAMTFGHRAGLSASRLIGART